ncbi:MAG: hypothetical protein DRI57_06845 [Deltaproteobacteria bacterium]|nr:MAG: hypothetical protein DRI57_06845 [Deltaproteobacteria bacterium]
MKFQHRPSEKCAEISFQHSFQFGHSRDDPALPQIKIMAAPDPLGMPLTTETVQSFFPVNVELHA